MSPAGQAALILIAIIAGIMLAIVAGWIYELLKPDLLLVRITPKVIVQFIVAVLPLATLVALQASVSLKGEEVLYSGECVVVVRLNASYSDGASIDKEPDNNGGGPTVQDRELLRLLGYIDRGPGDLLYANDKWAWHIVETQSGRGYLNFYTWALGFTDPTSFPAHWEHMIFLQTGNRGRCSSLYR